MNNGRIHREVLEKKVCREEGQSFGFGEVGFLGGRGGMEENGEPPLDALKAVLVSSVNLDDDKSREVVVGHDFSEVLEGGRVDYDALFGSYARSGFQASHFGRAVEIVENMVRTEKTKAEKETGSRTRSCFGNSCFVRGFRL